MQSRKSRFIDFFKLFLTSNIIKYFGYVYVPKIFFSLCDLWFVKQTEAVIAFGVHLRKLREKRNMSQQELADMSDISKKTIQRIENGKLNPSLDTLLCLATGLKLNLPLLVDFNIPHNQ